MPAINQFTDGHYGTFDEVEGGGTSHPFKNRQVKDVTTYIRRRVYEGERAAFTPATATLADPDDVAALLLEESEMEPIGGDLVRVIREFGPVPLAQVRMDMRKFARPSMHDLFVPGGLGYVYAVSFDQLVTSHLFFDRKQASIGAPAVAYLNVNNELSLIGHQQVTVEMDNSAQSFYLDDSDATIKNALSTAVVGNPGNAANFYVSRWKYGIMFSWAGITPRLKGITITSTEISIGERTINVGTVSSTGPIEIISALTYLTSIRTVSTLLAHGAVAGNRVAFFNGDRVVGMSKVIAVPTADTCTIATKDFPDGDAIITHVVFDKDGLRLVNGTKDCTVRQTENYFRAGVTAGIATLADIPPVTTYEDPLAWLGRIVATTLTDCTATAITDLLGKPAHGLSTGDIFFILDKGIGAAGLATLTLYWAIKVDADNWQAAASAELAKAGTALPVGSGSAAMKILVPAPWPALTVSQLQVYKGPIVFKTTEEIQMADALITRAPTG